MKKLMIISAAAFSILILTACEKEASTIRAVYPDLSITDYKFNLSGSSTVIAFTVKNEGAQAVALDSITLSAFFYSDPGKIPLNLNKQKPSCEQYLQSGKHPSLLPGEAMSDVMIFKDKYTAYSTCVLLVDRFMKVNDVNRNNNTAVIKF